MPPKFFQGEALFQTHENLEHLAMMERVLGPLPEHMIRRAKCVLQFVALFPVYLTSVVQIYVYCI